MLEKGLYEQLINESLHDSLENEEDHIETVIDNLDPEELPKVLGTYVGELTEKVLTASHEKGRNNEYETAFHLVNQLVDVLSSVQNESVTVKDHVYEQNSKMNLLYGVFDRKNNLSGKKPDDERPETSIAFSSLFTGAKNEPNIADEFKREIKYADRIDMLVSFIKWSGIRLILDDLNDFVSRGGKLRVITTTYMGASDAIAIDRLSKLANTEVKISHDVNRTRLHAKTYVFYRNTGFTTAYIGSSNLSNVAMSDGLEWNMKITQHDLPETFRKIEASFDNYWNMAEFETYHSSKEALSRLHHDLQIHKAYKAGNETINADYYFHIEPYSYQKDILDQLDADRKLHDHYRNLIVAATGTGKTVISAFDYKRFREENPGKRNRLLFIAHREEILKQSIACFRGVLEDHNFGDLLVGDYMPQQYDYLFVSIASFNSHHFIDKTRPDYFDYIVIDESHHDAAASYQGLLMYYKPKILLGMTATPERMDGKSILPYFDNHISAEIRLPEAIDRKLLSPFQFFVVRDVVDLDGVSWRNGAYVRKDLERAYIADAATAKYRADVILRAIDKYGLEISQTKGLGFCATIHHAEYMADQFNAANVASVALSSNSTSEQRKTAAADLRSGKIHFIFVVDLYNEGVDIREVNTILFLRPTESLTVFLQQLGRGLRLAEGKDYLTVLDFVGQANANYDYESRFTALLETSHRDIRNEITSGFQYLPKGCSILMEKEAQKIVLNNIQQKYKGSLKSRIIRALRTFQEDQHLAPTIYNFLNHSSFDIRDLYKDTLFYQCKSEAGLLKNYKPEIFMSVKQQSHALRRAASINSRNWIRYILDLLNAESLPDLRDVTSNEYRLLQMFQYTIWNQSYESCHFQSPLENIQIIRNNPFFCAELKELLDNQLRKIDFVDEEVNLGFDCPLDLHCCYTRDQILSAMDVEKPQDMREGVKWLKDKKTDILLVTLNKAENEYSPTTLYQDYSISDTLFHWQSQSTTSANSVTGQRYIHHKELGTQVLLFVRKYKTRNNKSGNESEPYAFLGKADYVKHEGSRPMSIIWKLEKPIPGKYLNETNKMIAD